MSEIIYPYINWITAYSVIISAILILRNRSRIRGGYSVIAFLACLFLYLIIDFVFNPLLKTFLVIGPFLIPFTFWMMAKALFSDQRQSTKRMLIYGIVTLLVYYSLFFLGQFTDLAKLSSILGRVLSVAFLVMAIVEIQSGRHADLDDERIRLRKYFTYFIGLVVLITILSELGLSEDEQELPRLIQRLAILVFNTLFIGLNFSINSRLFDTRKKISTVKHPDLIEKIQEAMLDNELFRKEKLSIGQLAETIGEQEYKVRRVINQEMGYRNFIDFTNSYRIKMASGLLKDQSQSKLTILEIAYKTGFNSIGPFNRAFKQVTGLTPTDFRKKHLDR